MAGRNVRFGLVFVYASVVVLLNRADARGIRLEMKCIRANQLMAPHLSVMCSKTNRYSSNDGIRRSDGCI